MAGQERLLVVMNVDVGDGRTGKISIKRGDDPVELARQFCDEHRLPVQAIPILTKSVEQSMKDAIAKADALEGEKQGAMEPGAADGEQGKEVVEQGKEEELQQRAGQDGVQEGERSRRPSAGHQAAGGVDPCSSRGRSGAGEGSAGRSQRGGGSAPGAGAGRGADAGGAAPSSRGPSRSVHGQAKVASSPRRMSAASPNSMEGGIWSRLLEPTVARRGKLAAARSSVTRSWSTGDLSAKKGPKSPSKQGRREGGGGEGGGGEGVWKRLYESGLDKIKSSNKAGMEGARPQSARAKREKKQDVYTTEPGPFQRLFDDSARRREIRESLNSMAEEERAKKDEEVMAPPVICEESRRIAESKSRAGPTIRVFDKLYKEGLKLVKSREAIHQPPQQQKDQSAAVPRASMFDTNNNVSAFTPDLWSSRSESRYNNVERSFERLDPFGEQRALLLEECEVEQEVSQLEGCSFRPQILPYSESLHREGSIFEHLYQHGLERHERQSSISPSRQRDAKPLSPSKSQALVDRLHNQPMQQLQQLQPLSSFSRTSTPSDKKPAFKPPGAPLVLDKTPPVPGTKSAHRSFNSSTSLHAQAYNNYSNGDENDQDNSGDEGIYGERRPLSSSALNAKDLYCMPARDPREMSTERHSSRQQAKSWARERLLGEASVLASKSHMSPASKTLMKRKQQVLVGMWFDHAVNRNRPVSELSDELGGRLAQDLVTQVLDDIVSRMSKAEVVAWEEFSEACDKRLHTPLAGGISPWDSITRIRRATRNNSMMRSSMACGGDDSQIHDDDVQYGGGAEHAQEYHLLDMTGMRTLVLDRATSAKHRQSVDMVNNNGRVATAMDKGQGAKQQVEHGAAATNSSKTMSVGERLLREAAQKNRERQEWLRGQKARRVAAELDECTFSPKILRNAGYEPYAIAKRK